MKRLAKKIDLDWSIIKDTKEEEAISNLKDAWKDFNSQKEQFPEWRRQFNKGLIDALSKEQRVAKKVIKDRMKREKASRDLGKKARRIRMKKQKNPILRAVVIDSNGNRKELNTQSSMVAAMAESNQRRQQQCVGTPFMKEPLQSIFGYLPSEEIAMQVYNGTIELPDNVSSFVKDFIEACKAPEAIRKRKAITLEVSPEENKSAWKKKSDYTGSAYGTPTYSFYKCASTDCTLNKIDAELRETPLIIGFTPTGWRTITDVQIKKRLIKMR